MYICNINARFLKTLDQKSKNIIYYQFSILESWETPISLINLAFLLIYWSRIKNRVTRLNRDHASRKIAHSHPRNRQFLIKRPDRIGSFPDLLVSCANRMRNFVGIECECALSRWSRRRLRPITRVERLVDARPNMASQLSFLSSPPSAHALTPKRLRISRAIDSRFLFINTRHFFAIRLVLSAL